jgi:hypothetical protein
LIIRIIRLIELTRGARLCRVVQQALLIVAPGQICLL